MDNDIVIALIGAAEHIVSTAIDRNVIVSETLDDNVPNVIVDATLFLTEKFREYGKYIKVEDKDKY